MTKVFISYSHDSDEHRELILDLSNSLRDPGGLDCWIDQYDPAPLEGWPRKMDRGIREADFVLMICTETYLRRLELEEEEGKGLGVAWEGSLIYNTLYRDRTLNTKFIPVLLKSEDKQYIPTILFGNSHYDLSLPRGNDHLYRHLRGELGALMPQVSQPRRIPRIIYSDDLPAVAGELFGRTDEMKRLDDALEDPDTHVVQFVAPGGTGKTKLLRHWIDENNERIEALVAWSFYAQGSSEDKQTSATPFFIQALKSLGSEKDISDFKTEQEKGEYVAGLLREKHCLLILDGLEPLQQVGFGMRGELKDQAIQKLLRCLAGNHSSLCIITTRLPVHELQGLKRVMQYNLQNLAPDDGVSLLRSFGVSGRYVTMLAAVEEYGGHALALHLLGNALTTYLDGNIHERDKLTELIGSYDDVERHAFKVMQAYQNWLEGTPELKLLYLLSLFDHPVDQDVLTVLLEAQIPELTADVPEKAWKVAQRDLMQKYQMISTHQGQDDLFDCHPLIREYFGRQLKERQIEVWQQAHTVLYEYYKGLPEKYYPDTLIEMQPLFRAVVHGCSAGLYLQSWLEIIQERIERKSDNYTRNSHLVDQLGAWQDSLSFMSSYFAKPWSELAFTTIAKMESNIFNRVAVCLDMLGRYVESAEAQRKAVYAARSDLSLIDSAVVNSYSLTLTLIKRGSLEQARKNSADTLFLASQSDFPQAKISSLCAFARVLHQQGYIDKAISKFKEAEEISFLSSVPFLHSLYGAHFCEILLDKNQNKEARKRSARALKKCSDGYSQLSVLSDQLIICQGWLGDKNLQQAKYWLSKAKLTLNSLGTIHESIEYYFIHSRFEVDNQNYKIALSLIHEVYEIAEPSGMRLHLTDYHLGVARLILAVENDAQYPETRSDCLHRILPFANEEEPWILTLEGHISEAAKLIEETGYHRRDRELAELQANISII